MYSSSQDVSLKTTLFTDPELESIALPVAEGRKNLWNKTKEAFKYIYKNHLDEADWFLKADDNTYVILENLRYLLYPHSPTFPIYMGCKFKFYVKQVSQRLDIIPRLFLVQSELLLLRMWYAHRF